MMDTFHFKYMPPALSESEMEYMKAKYEDPDESRLIYHIRSPIVTKLEELSQSNVVDDRTTMFATILRVMYTDDFESRFSNEWMLMCSFANDSIVFSEDRINAGEYSNKLAYHLMMNRFPINMPSYSWLDRQFCYRWIYRFDHPETLVQIEQELNDQFGDEAQNPKDLVEILKVPSKLCQVAHHLSVEEMIECTRRFYDENTTLSIGSMTELLFEETMKRQSGATSTTTG